ncbi:MAG: hypothetical protein DWQ34_20375 [Planctomycetota bacterium]|nr:MAG: hypothetical protein DWQ34_20375 [Planctomycetota bacterium]REK29787.1 MAG: hypothetical protein DWQ41_03920 [Planctomycetota bacterium]
MTAASISILASSGLVAFDYAVVLIYLAGALGAGWYFSREQHEVEDYFVGGRQMPWLAVGLSIVATMLSTVTYLAAPGEVIQHGLAFSIGFLALPIAFLIVNWCWIPFFMRLRVTSIYEYLERRFGLAARWTAVFQFVFILRFLWMATIILTASRAVAQITYGSLSDLIPLDMSPDQWTLMVLLAVSLLATLYTMLGGIKAVIWTDVAQFIVLFGGVVFTLVFVSLRTGTGPQDWWEATTSASGAGHEFPPLASWDLTARNTILFTVLSAVFWYSCTYIADQVAVQRYLTTPSVQAAVRGNIVNFAADFAVMILLVICGMALLTYYLDPQYQTVIAGGISDPRDPSVSDKVFPHFIAHGLPPGISGLVVAALFAVAMSSLDSGINSVSTVLTVDVFNRLSPDRGPAQQLRLARWITLVTGLVCTALALAMLAIPESYNIIDITARTYNCALGPLAGLMLSAMFLPRVSQWAAVVAAWAGLAAAVVCAWGVEIGWAVGATEYETAAEAAQHIRGLSPFLITPLATTATFLLAGLLGLIFPSADKERGRASSWRTVVSRL